MPSDSTTTPFPPEASELDALDAIDDQEADAPQVMLVRVSDDRLALPVGEVQEVLRARPTMPVPGTPAWVSGLVALRGVLVPVADLVRRGGVATAIDAPWLVVAERGGRRVALGVAAIDGVHPVDDGMRPPLGHPRDALPRRASVRLLPREVGNADGVPAAADVLDVGALFDELFDGE